jgi:hypothetical protein
MVGLGQSYWIYGYVFLYLTYSVVLSNLIARDYFPLEGEIVTKNPAKFSMHFFKNPIYLLIILSGYFFALMAIVTVFKLQKASGVELKKFYVQVNRKEFEIDYIELAGMTIFLVICLYVFFALIRVLRQKAQGGNF